MRRPASFLLALLSVVLYVAAFLALPSAALQNRPREEAEMRGARDDELLDYHDEYRDHSHDEHNFDVEGHKHVHWEL